MDRMKEKTRIVAESLAPDAVANAIAVSRRGLGNQPTRRDVCAMDRRASGAHRNSLTKQGDNVRAQFVLLSQLQGSGNSLRRSDSRRTALFQRVLQERVGTAPRW